METVNTTDMVSVLCPHLCLCDFIYPLYSGVVTFLIHILILYTYKCCRPIDKVRY